MQTLTEKILKYTAALPEGAPISAKQLLHLGNRPAVDQALSRLRRREKLMRASRGLYVRPVSSRFGVRAPAAEKVAHEFASSRGETIARHGAAAANALGLTTQVPTRLVYLTSGPSRQLKLGAQVVELKHVPSWQLAFPKQTAGEAVRALLWMGKEQAPMALAKLKPKLTFTERKQLNLSRQNLPEWLAQSVSQVLTASAR